MEYYEIEKQEHGLHVHGFPDAVKLLKLSNAKAKRLADLALHKHDLDFALQCLDGINLVAEEPYALRLALWRSAIVHYFKCFGNSAARFSLDQQVIYTGEPVAIENFESFRLLRNKNIVHDENSYTQCIPGAVLNKAGMEHKIAKILCSSFHAEALGQDSFSNLRLLITHATEWVTHQFDELCNLITADLESLNYEELYKMESVTYSRPTMDDLSRNRNAR
jgi:hypothetical protein